MEKISERQSRNVWLITDFIDNHFSCFGLPFSPDNSPYANTMHLEIATQKPGFKVQILHLPKKQTKQTSFFNRLLQGSPNKTREIPISEIDVQQMRYRPFAADLSMPWKSISQENYQLEDRTYLFWYG